MNLSNGNFNGGNVLYLEKIDINHQVQLKSFVDTSYPAYATSLDKALLANKSEFKKLYPQAFKKMTEKTLNNIEELHTELKKKKNKIAIESEEMKPQIKCMAIEHKDKIIAAISILYLLYYSNEKFREANKKITRRKK